MEKSVKIDRLPNDFPQKIRMKKKLEKVDFSWQVISTALKFKPVPRKYAAPAAFLFSCGTTNFICFENLIEFKAAVGLQNQDS